MNDRQTEVIQIDPIRPDPAIIARAAELLRSGELVVFPTETVYGLGANALQADAVEKIFAAKGRPYSDPLIAHIADEHDLEQVAIDIPPIARDLARTFWPGPLTLILPADPHIPRMVTAGLATVAVRMPRHPVALALIRAAGLPIAAPSANRFMHVSPTTAQHVLSDLSGRVPLILDGGPCAVGVESTILDLCSDVPTILRPGGISLEALRAQLPAVQAPVRRVPNGEDSHDEQQAQKSPGQMLIHYAPAVPSFLIEGSGATMRATMLAEVQRRQAQGERVGVLIADEDLATFQQSGAQIYTLGRADEPEQIATHLFAGLRILEESGVQVILCRSFSEQGLGLAIRDRLLKATGGKIFPA
ncbi:threonylcarbamoyl-AMP synthase [Reticulibacter mediterranei]|uniref:Threonylcarbamoyl-AMP synthase n=1 Tax=Reticulibacter mediterranei TaxID=2778369 RepID=A0A8J3ILB7_9CHLR|nr:L-threonylcarbamoyladenylate synthase [Reticulibacter mediterranei]GHO95943.1 threonylcarbamoyl-AMP synthase [Reticulibacter mediterranei]